MKRLFTSIILVLAIFATSCSNMIEDLSKVKITYSSQHGIVPKDCEIEINTALTSKELPVLEENGYTFNGWYSGNTQIKEKYVIKDDLKLTAKWNDMITSPYKVFKNNVELINGSTSNEVNYTDRITITSNEYDNFYYSFEKTDSVPEEYSWEYEKYNWIKGSSIDLTYQKNGSLYISVIIVDENDIPIKSISPFNCHLIVNNPNFEEGAKKIPIVKLFDNNKEITKGTSNYEIDSTKSLKITGSDFADYYYSFEDNIDTAESVLEDGFENDTVSFMPSQNGLVTLSIVGVNKYNMEKISELFTVTLKINNEGLNQHGTKIPIFKVMNGNEEIKNGSIDYVASNTDTLKIVGDEFAKYYFIFKDSKATAPSEVIGWHGRTKEGTSIDLKDKLGYQILGVVAENIYNPEIKSEVFCARIRVSETEYDKFVEAFNVKNIDNPRIYKGKNYDKLVENWGLVTITAPVNEFSIYHKLEVLDTNTNENIERLNFSILEGNTKTGQGVIYRKYSKGFDFSSEPNVKLYISSGITTAIEIPGKKEDGNVYISNSPKTKQN